jgi:hypothetical protein
MKQASCRVRLAQISQCVGDSYYLPYSVGLLQAYIQGHASDPTRYLFEPPIYQRLSLQEGLTAFGAADVVGLSLYVWNELRSLAIAQALKAQHPEQWIVVGGPQVPDQAEAFLRAHPYVDVCVHGPGEIPFLQLLETWPATDWREIAGLSYVREGAFVHQPQAPRPQDLAPFPSPYLTGVFDPIMAASHRWIGLLETNRGCPFACTYCDWGSAIQSKVYRFPMERVEAELEWMAQNKVWNIFTCDANFGILPRDVEIARYAAQMKQQYGYPQAFQNQTAKNVTGRVVEIQKILTDAGLTAYAAISLQTVDVATLKAIKRDNISLATYQEIQNMCLSQGIYSYTDMIMGLPGETYTSFVQGLDTIIAHGQHNKVLFHNATILPNAEMANPAYRQAHGIETAVVALPGIVPLEDGIPELMEIIVATASLPREDWLRSHLFAWLLNFLYYTHRMFQLPLMVTHHVTGTPMHQLIELFMYPPERYPLLTGIRNALWDTALRLQRGYPESQSNSLLFSPYDGVYMTPDTTLQIRLGNAGQIDAFFREAGELLMRYTLGLRSDLSPALLEDALLLSRRMFMRMYRAQKFPFPVSLPPVDETPLMLRYNLQAFYHSVIRGQPIALEAQTPTPLPA